MTRAEREKLDKMLDTLERNVKMSHDRRFIEGTRRAIHALLAAMEPQGEVYEVKNGYVDGVGHAWVDVCDLVRGLPSSQRVRVTRVEDV